MTRRNWNLDEEQMRRLRDIAPDAIDLFMVGLNGMAAQTQDAINLLRKEISEMNLENSRTQEEVAKLRAEIARMKTTAAQLQAILNRSR